MFKKVLMSTALLSCLVACSQKPVINKVNLIPVKSSELQTPINQGYNSRMVGHNAEWAKFGLRVSAGCPLNYETMKVERNTFDMPIFEGHGYMDMVYKKNGYSIYVQPTLIENYQNKYHVNMVVSLKSDNLSNGYVFSKEIQLPNNSIDGSGLPVSTPLWRFDIASGVTCEMQATVLPSSGSMSRKIWNGGVGSNEFNGGSKQLGTPLSMENNGGTISDVMSSGNGYSGTTARSPSFHDPFNVDQGGMGKMVR